MNARRGTAFHEVMEGTVLLDGERTPRPVRLDLHAAADRLLRPLGSTTARLTGRVRVKGWADDRAATGTLEIAPVTARRIRYRIAFEASDGTRHLLDGWKSVTPRRPLRSMTELPFVLEGAAGEGTLRFPLRRQLVPFLAGWRFPRQHDGDDWFAPRSAGRPGRLEVWYSTATDPATGTGVWLHHETVSPPGGGPAHALGWAAVFPPDGPPALARFGPLPVDPGPHDEPGFHAGPVHATAHRLSGSCDGATWDLAVEPGDARPLHTFPRAAWERGLLPAAHVVPLPAATLTGTVTHGSRTLRLDAAPGGSARIDGRGNAHRWGWLRADLGDGDVLEIVAAVSGLPLLRSLPPLVFLRLRTGGRDWPRGDWRTSLGLAGAGRFRAELGFPAWTVTGRAGRRRIRVEVRLPDDATAAVDYADPDGTALVCRNSERADALVVVERREGGRWRTELRRTLDGTAHAEVGGR